MVHPAILGPRLIKKPIKCLQTIRLLIINITIPRLHGQTINLARLLQIIVPKMVVIVVVPVGLEDEAGDAV